MAEGTRYLGETGVAGLRPRVCYWVDAALHGDWDMARRGRCCSYQI